MDQTLWQREGNRTRGLLAVAAVACICAVWAPGALGSWSAPVTISRGHTVEGELALASGPSPSVGFADMVAWKYGDVRPQGAFGPTLAGFSFTAGAGPFGPERALPASYGSGPLVDFGGGRVGQLIYARNGTSTSTLKVALGWVGGPFGVPQRISNSVWGHSASLAGDLAGCAVVAWITSPRTAHRQVWASVRPPNGHFGAARLLSANANGLAVTAAAGPPSHRNPVPCDVAVAFDSKNGRMLVRIRPHNHGWGPVQDIGPAAVGTQNEVATYIGRDGRVTVAWFHQQLSEGGPLGPAFAQVAVQPPGAHHFLYPQTLERDPVGVASTAGVKPVIEGVDGGGRVIAFLAQPGPASAPGRPAVVRVSYGRGSRYEPPHTLSPAGQQASALSGAEGLGAILAWIGTPTTGPASTRGSRAAVFAADTPQQHGTRIGGVQQVSPDEGAESALAGASVLGQPWIVAWTSPVSATQTVVRVSTGS